MSLRYPNPQNKYSVKAEKENGNQSGKKEAGNFTREEECKALLDVLFHSNPCRNKYRFQDEFVAQLNMTRHCDVIMPFLAVVRENVNASVERPLTAASAYAVNEDLVTRNLRRQYWDTFGFLPWLRAELYP